MKLLRSGGFHCACPSRDACNSYSCMILVVGLATAIFQQGLLSSNDKVMMKSRLQPGLL